MRYTIPGINGETMLYDPEKVTVRNLTLIEEVNAVRIGKEEITFDEYLELHHDCSGQYRNRMLMRASIANIRYAEQLRKGGRNFEVAV